MLSYDNGDDFVRVCGPSEGFAIIVRLREAVGGLETDNASVDTSLQSPLVSKKDPSSELSYEHEHGRTNRYKARRHGTAS